MSPDSAFIQSPSVPATPAEPPVPARDCITVPQLYQPLQGLQGRSPCSPLCHSCLTPTGAPSALSGEPSPSVRPAGLCSPLPWTPASHSCPIPACHSPSLRPSPHSPFLLRLNLEIPSLEDLWTPCPGGLGVSTGGSHPHHVWPGLCSSISQMLWDVATCPADRKLQERTGCTGAP